MAKFYQYPDGQVSAGSFVPTGAATNHEAIDDLQGAPDGNTTYAQGSHATGSPLICTLNPAPDMVECLGISAIAIVNNAGAGSGQEARIGVKVAGVTDSWGAWTAVSSSTYTPLTHPLANNPVTGAPWTKPQLDELQIQVDTRDAVAAIDSVRVTSAYIDGDYQPIGEGVPIARGILSHRLRRYREEIPKIALTSRLDITDAELVDNVSVSHFELPTIDPDGDPYGIDPWERQLFMVAEEEIDINTMTVTHQLHDQSDLLCLFWDTAESRISSSATEDGVARLGTGGAVVYTRLSDGWYEDPGSRLVGRTGNNQKPIAYQGMLMENFAGNFLKHSSASEGATSLAGLSPTGTGVNGSSITAEASPIEPLFDPTISDHCYLMTAGTPNASNLVLAWPATASIAANTKVRFSIDHLDTATEILAWRLVRSVDSNLWNDSTEAWQAGAVNNNIPSSSSRARDFSKVIDVGGAGTTLTLSLRLLTGGTSGRTHRVYHVQIEENAWATSHIVTTATTQARAIQTYSVEHILGTGQIAFNNSAGTFMVECIPEWDGADMDDYGGFPALFWLEFDPINLWGCFYNSGTSTLDFIAIVEGVQATASIPWTPVRGTVYRIACRWIGAAGELDEPPLTISVFLDGVRGTDAVRDADPTEGDTLMYIGGDAAGNAFNGNVRRILSKQKCLTDEEIKGFRP